MVTVILATLACHHWSSAQQRGDARPGERCRHDQQPQVGSQRGPRFDGEREPQVGVEASLVELVKDHRADPLQRGVRLYQPGEDPFGDHLDSSAGTDSGVVAHAVANEFTHSAAKRRCQTARGSPSRNPAWFEHEDALVAEPVGVEQRQGNPRGLASARRGLKHCLAVFSEARQ